MTTAESFDVILRIVCALILIAWIYDKVLDRVEAKRLQRRRQEWADAIRQVAEGSAKLQLGASDERLLKAIVQYRKPSSAQRMH